MAGKLLNIKFYSPFKLHSGLTGKYCAICHYTYNIPLCCIKLTFIEILLTFDVSIVERYYD